MISAAAATNALTRTRVLVIDDSLAVRGVIRTLLRGLGVTEVYDAWTAEDAIVLANTCRPDVALVDYDLGMETGLEVIRSLRDRRLNPVPDMPLLLMAPVDLPYLVEGARGAGATAILPKPLNAGTLGQSLEALMGAREQVSQRAASFH